jgi:hypothetical protein
MPRVNTIINISILPARIIACAMLALVLVGRPCAAGDAAGAQHVQEGMHGRVFVGYQGWFAPAVEGSGLRWIHYGAGGRFAPGNCVIDMWPDLAGFDEDELYPTDFRHADGRVAHVFSSANPKTVDRHFEWMKHHGIDGAFLQRFATSARSRQLRPHLSAVLENVRSSAAKHGRAWSIMYDLSGLRAGQVESVMQDWKTLATELRVREDPAYLRHRGRPVVTVWGIGFNDGRQYTLEECRQLVRFLKNDPECGGNTVMLGVPYRWRRLDRDTVADPVLHEIIAEADIISPWAVGRYQRPEQLPGLQKEAMEADLRWLEQRNLEYMPVIFPGFSWHNLQKRHGREASLNQIPRRGGEFLWAQAAAVRRSGASMVYVAMFDEVDEATAIFKVSNDPPVGDSPFLTYEGLPADHYLWLTGQIGRLMRGEIEPAAMPRR